MPVNIPRDLPARAVLEAENVFVMTHGRAVRQDIRPLRIAVVNLMPTKVDTETQLLRLLSSTPLQVEVTLVRTGSYRSRNTAAAHLDAFYRTVDQVREERFDGLIITGAPIELLPFEDVEYWPELVRVMDWSRDHVYSTLHVCWGAQAGLYHHHGIAKHELPTKLSGVFEHRVLAPRARLVTGFDEVFTAPHSRHTGTRVADVEAAAGLEVLAVSDDAGLYLAATPDGRQVYVTGHPEYDRDTLRGEYERDLSQGRTDVALPVGYFPDDDPGRTPRATWRSHAFLLYANWLNYVVYQQTPYDLDDLGSPAHADGTGRARDGETR